MSGGFPGTRHPIETGLLLALCFFLPLLEAPKNLLWLAYGITWLVNRARGRDFGGRWDLWDGLIAAWIASGSAAAAFAGLHGGEWRGAADLLRYGSVLWLVKRGGYAPRELKWMLGALVASAVVGLVGGYARIWTGLGSNADLELNSVGHVNHTAIYLAIILGLCVSWLFARWQAWPVNRRAVALAVTVLVLVSLVVTASRGAVGVGLAMIPLLALAWWPRWRAPLAASVVAVALVAGVVIGGGAEVFRKHEANIASDNVLSYRDGIWRMAIAGWQRYPWFGVGMDNYKLITYERVKAWRAAEGKDYVENRYVYFTHGHSLYLNALAERGLVGLAALAAVLLAWLAFLLQYLPKANGPDEAWLFWGAAAAAWMVTAGAGLFNTTLHHEHGILSALLLGAWLASLRARGELR
jgi:O-antigen ligase